MVSFGAETQWVPVEVLAAYQRVTAEVQIRGRVRQILNDPQPEMVPLRNLNVKPLVAGAQSLSNLPEGALSKTFMGVVVPLAPEAVSPDEIIEKMRRHVLVQGETFTVRGLAEFPVAVDQSLHREQLIKSRFFPVVDAAIEFVGGDGETWRAQLAYVNRDLVVGLFLS